MLKRVSISNFQSLRDVELELGPLTVLYGESNKGKSAVIRALQAWAFNSVPKGFIWQGADAAVVEVTFEDGERIAWMKGTTGRYVINDGESGERVFTKIGQKTPEEVAKVSGFRRIEVDATKLYPQLADQHDSPFLLRESEGKAARVLAKLTRLDIVLNAAANANRDLKRARQRLQDTEEQREEKEQQREQYADLPEREARLMRFEDAYTELEETLSALDEAERKYRVLSEIDEFLALPYVDVSRVEVLLESLTFLNEAEEQYAELQRLDRQINSTEEELARLAREVERYESEMAKYDVCPTCGQVVTREVVV